MLDRKPSPSLPQALLEVLDANALGSLEQASPIAHDWLNI
jgi:hypothetical protein